MKDSLLKEKVVSPNNGEMKKLYSFDEQPIKPAPGYKYEIDDDN